MQGFQQQLLWWYIPVTRIQYLPYSGASCIPCRCVINWNKGKNVTVRVIKKKQKHQKSGTTRTITKEEQQDSFFNFFTPPARKFFSPFCLWCRQPGLRWLLPCSDDKPSSIYVSNNGIYAEISLLQSQHIVRVAARC